MTAPSDTSRDVTAALQRTAGTDKVLWVSQPDPVQIVAYRLRNGYWGAVFMAAFSVFWMAIALSATTSGKNVGVVGYIFPLFGVPFLALGLWSLVAPWREAAKARQTLFALTNNRLLHITPSYSGVTTRSLVPNDMLGVSLVESAEGSGTLSITLAEREDWGRGSRSKTLDMIGVAEAAIAMRLIEALRTGRKVGA
jgi:hypothetical protein